MYENELEEVLAFLDDVDQDGVLAGGLGGISLLNENNWEPPVLLDGGIGDFAAEAPTTTDDQTFGKTKRRKKKQLNPNRARNDRLFQLKQLRQEVDELELTLKQWQDIRSQPKTASSSGKTDDALQDQVSGVPAVWEDICANQLRRRLKAERENIHLKEQYKEEMQVAKRVEKLLYKRLIPRDVPQSEANKHIRRTNLPPGYIKHIAARIFEELSAGIEVCYLLGNDVLGTSSSNSSGRMPLLRGGLKGTERTLFDRRVLPFSKQATDDAWWHDWNSYRGQKGEITDNVVVESFGVEMNDFKANTSVTSYGQQILKRDVKDDRTVFVWNAYLEPLIFEAEQVSDIYFLEQCHMIIKTEEEIEMDEGDSASCMSCCYVVTPYFLDATLENDRRTTRLIDFLVGTLFANMKAHNNMAEDLLLEQVLQKSIG
ncbi:hypothetical protein V7S43_002047 [Phytophthora oleae]|uniref:M96 mating-specific protein family n=1 Tax=Phytophthora oleae TaxID=2107226 RepID=A0ABD3G445_9STRA